MKPTTPGSHRKKIYICQRTKECFDSSIKANLQFFQKHKKQAKNNIVFHFSSLLGLNEVQGF